MEALGALSPMELAEGQIQKYVGEFLAMKAVLNNLRGSDQLNVRSQAEALYVQQTQLEQELTQTLAKIEEIKKGAWGFGDVITISNFGYNLYSHITKVKQLRDQAVQSGGMPELDNPGKEMMIFGALGALALGWYLWKR